MTDFIHQTLSELGEVTVQSRELLRMRDVVHFRQILAVTSTTTNSKSSSGSSSGSGSISGLVEHGGERGRGDRSIGGGEGVSGSGGGVLSGPDLLQWAAHRLHPTPAVCGIPTGMYYSLSLPLS